MPPIPLKIRKSLLIKYKRLFDSLIYKRNIIICFTHLLHISCKKHFIMILTPYLRPDNRKKKQGYIKIRIQSKKFGTKYENINNEKPEVINKSNWNKIRNEVRSNHDRSEELNQMIFDKINEIRNRLNGEELLIAPNSLSYISYYREWMNRLEKRGQHGTRKTYNSSFNHLISLLSEKGKDDLLFDEIDHDFLEDYEDHLVSQEIANTSQKKYIKCLKRVYHLALKTDVYSTLKDPYRNYKIPNGVSNKEYLTINHIKKLTFTTLERGSDLERTRNRFLVQIFGQGMRISDLMTIRYKNLYFDDEGDRIDIIQFKTKKPHSIHISRELLRYLFFFLDKEAYYKIYYDNKIQTSIVNNNEMTIRGLENLYFIMSEDKHENKEYISTMVKVLEDVYKDIYKSQIKKFKQKSKTNPNDFILDFFDSNLFKDVEFDSKRKLSKKQRSRFESRQVPYNKSLKKLDDIMESGINITSHTSRHSFSHKCLKDGFSDTIIMNLLGHSSITTTQNYLKGIDNKIIKEKVRKSNNDFTFTLLED